jgi:hypothetical protein
MESLLLLLFFPLAWPFIAKRIWSHTINWQEMALQILIVVSLTTGVWQLGKYGQMADTEIWNGEVISKLREHGHYVRSYECNCHEVCSGDDENESCSSECDTCYEDHYTVKWSADTTVGGIIFDEKDSTWRSVYNSPDPPAFVRCTPHEPASLPKRYTNYIQAVPESLFNTHQDLSVLYKDMIPEYPKVYDFYKIDRIIDVGAGLTPEVHKILNDGLNHELIALGHSKQTNIILFVTNIKDPMYRYAIENAWLGGKKNDVIAFIGTENNKIIWTDVMTWALNSGNELFQVTTRDDLKKIGEINPTKVVSVISENIAKHYDRPQMKDYQYLESSIEPPAWVIVFSVILSVGGSLGLTVIFHRTDIDFLNR